MGRGQQSEQQAITSRTRSAAPVNDAERPTVEEMEVAVALPETDPDHDWFQFDPAVRERARQVARELNCDEIVATRLAMFGKSPQEITDYLHPAPQHISHPEATMPGMMEAARQLADGVAQGDVVAIYADYDVDGHSSLAILAQTLAGYDAKIFTGSANQKTGFGLTRQFVEEAARQQAKWLITLDCGSTQTEPVRLAQSLGMQVIVVDHHSVDPSNPANHHLNPRLLAHQALSELAQAMPTAGCRQQIEAKPPYDEQLDRLSERSRQQLAAYCGQQHFDELVTAIENFAHPTSTGSMLTWKFAAAFHLAHRQDVPSDHYGQPLYLAGLGAIADLAPCNNQEVRAFVRVSTNDRYQRDYFKNRRTVPLGVEMLAEELGENATRPDELMRTRAVLNLAKRSGDIDPQDIQTLLTARKRSEIEPVLEDLIDSYERISAIRRNEMDPRALEQIAAAEASGQTTKGAYAILDGFENYSGYARMTANTVVKATGKPAFVFVRKSEADEDEFGQALYKFSGANGVVPEAKLGELIEDPAMKQACTIRMRDWLGQDGDLVNLGGHSEVVSGVCTAEEIPNVIAAIESWAESKGKDWRPISKKRPRIAARCVSPTRLDRLERDAQLLAPLAFPESPAVQVSVKGRFAGLREDEESGQIEALMVLEDGSNRPVILSDEVAQLAQHHPDQRFEAIIALGRSAGRYFVSTVAPR